MHRVAEESRDSRALAARYITVAWAFARVCSQRFQGLEGRATQRRSLELDG